jgi:hypothetical protein
MTQSKAPAQDRGAIIDWFLQNSPELFSGIGALAVAALCGLAYKRWTAWREQRNRIAAARARAAHGTAPTPFGKPLDPSSHSAWAAFGDVPQVNDPREGSYGLSRYCSFCKQSESKSRKFVAGPAANICEECIEKSLNRLDTPAHNRREMVLQLKELTFKRENPQNDHFKRESYRPEIDRLALALRRRRRENPGDIVANARLIRTVGAGNFSTVWEARRVTKNSSDTGRVAVKIFEQDKLPLGLMLWRFQRGLMAMEHFRMLGTKVPKFIVPLIDIDDDLLSFSMPFLSGGDLQTLRSRHLSLDRRLELFSQVCVAVRFAHEQGIIHRDIKPANVVLDADGDAVLTDFDIADITFARTQSVLSGGLGTPQFAAPEQLLAASLDAHPTGDIYSLGKLLVFLLTQSAPPHGSARGRRVPEYIADLEPARFRRPVAAALQQDPSARPQSVAEFLSLFPRSADA